MLRALLLNIVLISLLAHTRDYTFERITSKDGLSQNNVLNIYQCSDGFMWFATYDGLNRYDGYDFKVYRASSDDTNSISENLISSLAEDADKNLWIGTFGQGICKLNKTTEQFTRYKSLPGIPGEITGEVYHIFIDSNRVWACNIYAVYYIEIKNDTIIKAQKFRHIPDDSHSLTEGMFYQAFKDAGGNLFIVAKGGVDLMIPTANGAPQNKFHHILTTENYKTIIQMGQTPEGYLFSHSLGLLLLKFDPAYPEKKEYVPLEEHYCKRFTIDTKGNIWAGGDEGVYRLEHTGNTGLPYRLTDHFIAGDTRANLSHKVIRTITVDHDGMIWIGTNGAGILTCNITKAKFRHYKKTKQKGSISANQVWSIFEDKEHNLWFSTEGGGLNLLPAWENKNYRSGFTDFRVNPVGEQNFAFQMIDFTCNGKTLYLAGVGYESKIVKIEKKADSWKITNILPELEWQVMALCRDEHGAAWLGTYGEGLYRIKSDDGVNFESHHFNPDNSKIPSIIIRSIFEDSQGRIWIGTDMGLVIVPRDEKAKDHPGFELIRNIPGNTSSLSHNYVVPITETHNGEIWIGTFGGALNHYIEGTTQTNGSFKRLGEKDGLPNNTIKQIVEDDLGSLWVSTNKGLSKIDSTRIKIRNYDINDGLQDMQFTDLSGSRLSDGELIFGGVNGFNAFYPDELYDDTTKPLLVFTDLEINNRKVAINQRLDGEQILTKVVNETETITLKYFQNSIKIFFSALYYDVPEGNQYKYKLERFDKEWIKTNYKSRFASYTNLSPGRYTFLLQASNSHGVWTLEPKSIDIIITPPYWRTWWFTILEVLVFIGLIVFVFRWRTWQIRNRNIELEKQVQQRTNEIREKNTELERQSTEMNETNVVLEERQQQIEEQAEELNVQKEELLHQRDRLQKMNRILQERNKQVEEQSEELTLQRDELYKANTVKDKLFSIVAHDLKNPFTSLSGLIDLLILKYDKYTNEKRKSILKHASSSAGSIQELLLNLLSWARSQTGTIHYKPAEANLVELLKSNIRLLQNQAEEKKIQVSMTASNEFIVFRYDPDLLNTVIRNLLSNALKFTPAGGAITLECTDLGTRVEIRVKDTGVGISAENIDKLFNPNTHFSTYGTLKEKGTGLGLLTCKEFVEMHMGTLTVESAVGKGTTFTMNIPKS